ncbi:MAG: DEAD/DEAH box helicase [Roseomonas sp.]|nr:DEAD/DEAH box helicase [Roseomonas sp.]
MTSAPAITLRSYQVGAIEGVRQAFRDGRRAPLLVAPTGAGKTVMFSFVAANAAARGKRVLILAHRTELIRQASRKLTEAGVQHGIIAPGFTPTRDLVQVASVQTLARRIASGAQPFDLIVVDEAHHAIAGQWRTVAEAYPEARMLGVTATPERLDGRGLGVAAGGCFDAMVMGPTVAELVAGGFLTPTRIFAPAEAPDLSGIRTRGGDFDAGGLGETMGQAKLVGDAVDHYRRYASGLPAILFSPSVAHAEQMAGAFRDAGFTAFAASGNTLASERDGAIAGLAKGTLQVLCSCDLISEGLDVPVVGCVILMRPTKSLGLYLQQVGRGLRPAPGKTHLIVLDHAGNTLRHGPPEMMRDWSLEGRAKRKKGDAEPTPPARQCVECFAVHAPAPKCPDCGFVYPVQSRELEHVAGELSDVTDDLAAKFGRHLPLKDVLAKATDSDLKLIAKARGFKPGWVWYQRQQRQAARQEQMA